MKGNQGSFIFAGVRPFLDAARTRLYPHPRGFEMPDPLILAASDTRLFILAKDTFNRPGRIVVALVLGEEVNSPVVRRGLFAGVRKTYLSIVIRETPVRFELRTKDAAMLSALIATCSIDG